ncbi:MAG: hypothetical protein O2861_14215 [Proteobacteria bacterium]|nr:hypothetical protein [Pseudomonadota bacterium]
MPVFLLLLMLLTPMSAGAQQGSQSVATHALTAGYYRAHGDFGLNLDTSIGFLPLSYEFERGNWGFQLLAAALEVEGPGAVLINLGGVNQAIAGSEITTERGVGDTIASAIYHFNSRSPTAAFFDLRFDIKLPTASEQKGLGTGEFDYNLQLDVSQQWRGLLLFSSLGYSVRGKSELFTGLRNGAYLQLGAALNLGDRLSGGIFYDYREPTSDFTPVSHELSPYLNWRLSDNWSFTSLLSKGYTEASPDWSFYTSLRYSW